MEEICDADYTGQLYANFDAESGSSVVTYMYHADTVGV